VLRAVVAGGTGLLGRAIAHALGERGYSVRVHYHRGADAADDLVARWPTFDAVQADLRRPGEAGRLLEGIDRLELLVIAVGAYGRGPLEQLDEDQIGRMMVLNVEAPLQLIRAALPALTAARGQVIQLLDIAATQPWRDHVAYAASKAAARHAVRCLALELAPQVRVNGIAPGLVQGASVESAELEARIPMGRAVSAEEVACSVLLLAEAPLSVTGQILAVDGGRALGRRLPKLQS